MVFINSVVKISEIKINLCMRRDKFCWDCFTIVSKTGLFISIGDLFNSYLYLSYISFHYFFRISPPAFQTLMCISLKVKVNVLALQNTYFFENNFIAPLRTFHCKRCENDVTQISINCPLSLNCLLFEMYSKRFGSWIYSYLLQSVSIALTEFVLILCFS